MRLAALRPALHRSDWTLQEANAALPQVARLVEQGRKGLAELRECEAHLEDLRIVHGEQVLALASPGHAEFAAYHRRFEAAREELEQVLMAFIELGAEVKDLDQGLVDFRGLVAGQEGYLCWKAGEQAIGFWHPLEGGFAARRPMPGATGQG
jgi:hypothetical protein